MTQKQKNFQIEWTDQELRALKILSDLSKKPPFVSARGNKRLRNAKLSDDFLCAASWLHQDDD